MSEDVVRGLKEALVYTRQYRDRTFVVKLGGEVLADREALADVAAQLALLESLSVRLVVVHGGGPQASELSRRLGLEPEFVAGRRVTTPEVLEVATMVYAGRLNVDVLAALRAHGVRAVGLSGVDAELLTAERRPPVEVRGDDGEERLVDYGEVGDVRAVDTGLLELLLSSGYVPVVASLAADAGGRVLNVNADTVAVVLATALRADKLVFLTGAPGLLRDPEDPDSVLPFADPEDLEALLEEGAITGGMRPKVEACIRAVRAGVRRTHIVDGRRPDALLVEVFTPDGSGTMIVAGREKRAYAESGW